MSKYSTAVARTLQLSFASHGFRTEVYRGSRGLRVRIMGDGQDYPRAQRLAFLHRVEWTTDRPPPSGMTKLLGDEGGASDITAAASLRQGLETLIAKWIDWAEHNSPGGDDERAAFLACATGLRYLLERTEHPLETPEAS